MYCNKCGYPLPEGSNVCSYCGNVNGTPNQNQAQTQQQPNQAPPPKQNFAYQQPPVYQQPIKNSKKCRYCQQLIDKKAKICPFCRKRQGESCLSVTIFIFLVLGFWCFIGNAILNHDDKSTDTIVLSQDNSGSEQVNKSATTVKLTKSQENALKQAKNYLETMPFSAKGLLDQLEFEGYSHDDALFAVSNCGADWNTQAALKAKSYLETMPFSRQSLIDQLLFEGFTQEQAEYGVSAIGY